MLRKFPRLQFRSFCDKICVTNSINQSPIHKKVPPHELNDFAPFLKPTFNFAAYANHSELLQQFVKLGVDLSKIERNEELFKFILTLNFDQNVKKHIQFLHDNGVNPDLIGRFFTKNPLILKEDLDDLQARINYLDWKQFNKESIARIISLNPNWLSWSTTDIDKRLGYFQNFFLLTGSEVRSVTTQYSKLITYDLDHVKLIHFTIKEEMGFDNEQIKQILIKTPRIFVTNKNLFLKKFDYIHNTMQISHEVIVHMPQVFFSRLFRIKERHLFLQKLNKAQYDAKKPNYVSIIDLVRGSDSEFAVDVAKSSLATFNLFLKSL